MTRHTFLFHVVRGVIVGFTGGLALGQALIFVMAALASGESSAGRSFESAARLSYERRAERCEPAASCSSERHPTVRAPGRPAGHRHREARFAP